jgi:ligand-binding SRPBCC domain-containing protein
MAVFHAKTRLHAPVSAVAAFHAQAGALKRLTPPPVFVRVHAVEPLAEGSRADFTLWFGPLPLRWLAIHTQVDPRSGFTDTQVRGPLQRWVHQHRWTAEGSGAEDSGITVLEDRIEYQHAAGLRGLLTRLLFAHPLLRLMFAYRHWVTRRAVESRAP